MHSVVIYILPPETVPSHAQSAVNSVFSEHSEEQGSSASAAGAPPPPVHVPTHQ